MRDRQPPAKGATWVQFQQLWFDPIDAERSLIPDGIAGCVANQTLDADGDI